MLDDWFGSERFPMGWEKRSKKFHTLETLNAEPRTPNFVLFEIDTSEQIGRVFRSFEILVEI